MRLSFNIKAFLDYYIESIKSKPHAEKSFAELLKILHVILHDDEEKVRETVEQQLTVLSKKTTEEGVNALFLLGFCYESGIGVIKKEKKEDEMYKKEVEMYKEKAVEIYNNPEVWKLSAAKTRLGVCYQAAFGGLIKNNVTAKGLYKQASNDGNAAAECYIGNIFEALSDRDPKQAFHHYQQSAFKGFAGGLFHLAVCYELGIGTDKDMKAAVENYQLAADFDHGEALWKMGVLHYDGTLVPLDKKKAFEYLNLAYKNGSNFAAVDLGICHQEGIGTPVNLQAAFDCFQLALQKNIKRAHFYLGQFYEKGIMQDKKEATFHYKQMIAHYTSAEVEARFNVHYHFGYFTRNKRGNIFLQMACFFMLKHGEHAMLEHGESAEELATTCFKKAVECDQLDNIYCKANDLENGQGVQKDVQSAMKFYEIAADFGCKKAQLRLAKEYLQKYIEGDLESQNDFKKTLFRIYQSGEPSLADKLKEAKKRKEAAEKLQKAEELKKAKDLKENAKLLLKA